MSTSVMQATASLSQNGSVRGTEDAANGSADCEAAHGAVSGSRSADSSPRSGGPPSYVRWQNLENLLLDGDGVLLFKMFLEGESNGHQLDFYFATDGFPKLFAKKDAASLRQLAKQIYNAFLRGDRSVRLRPETRAALGDKLRDEQPARNMFETAKRETFEFLREAHRAFLCSDVFINFVREGASSAPREGASASESDSHSCCSAASGSSECLSQIASGTASAGANQSQSGSVRASTYLPALPEDANEVLAGEQAPLEDLHERQFQLLQEQLSLDDDNSPLRSNAPTSSQLPARLASDSSATPLVPSGSQNSSASLPLTTPRTARNELSLFPAVHCDQALVTATSANALKLNKENLRKTQLSRAAEPSSAVFGPTHPAYMPANTSVPFSNRKPPNPYYTSYATVSTQDSELQSQSSDALNDDGSSLLNENNADSQAHKRHKYQQRHPRRSMQQNRDNLQVLHVVPAPSAQIDATERELSTKQPAVFAQRLAGRLQAVLDEQMKTDRMSSIMNDPNSPANLTANLQKDDAALAFAASRGVGAAPPPVQPRALNSDAMSRLASLTNRLAVDLEHQDAQSILEEHCSRVWEKSNELTPIRAASPPLGTLHPAARPGSSRQSSRAYASNTRAAQPSQAANAFHTLPLNSGLQQVAYPPYTHNAGPNASLSTSAYESRDDAAAYGAYSRYQPAFGLSQPFNPQAQSNAGPYSVSSYATGYYHGPTSKSDTGCSDLSDAIVLSGPASAVHGGPLRPLSESASTGSVVAISHITCASGSASSGIVSDYSLATTASGASRSHRKSSLSQTNASGRPSDKQVANLTSTGKRQNPLGNQTLSANNTNPSLFGPPNSGLQHFVAQQSLNGRLDMPRQPFMSNPLMPPVPQPNTDTQIAEAARRLASSAARSDEERSQTSSLPRSHAQTTGAMQAALSGVSQAASGECTQVIYYLPNEKVPYRSTLPMRNVTLAQFRSTIIAKRDLLRCFFKKTCDEVEAGAVFEEITADDTVLPLFEGKIVARLERVE